jgi:hypothetical protein
MHAGSGPYIHSGTSELNSTLMKMNMGAQAAAGLIEIDHVSAYGTEDEQIPPALPLQLHKLTLELCNTKRTDTHYALHSSTANCNSRYRKVVLYRRWVLKFAVDFMI